MEPFSALAVATAACQFLDFTSKIVQSTWKIYNSNVVLESERHSHFKTIAEDLTKLDDTLHRSVQRSTNTSLASEEREVLQVAEKCEELATRLINTLNQLHGQQSRSKVWDSFTTALRAHWKKEEIDSLIEDLRDYRQQIILHLIISQRNLIISTDVERKQANDESTKVQLAAIKTNNELCRKILDKVNRTDGQADVLAAIQYAYSQGGDGIMAATSVSQVQDVLREHDAATASVGQLVLHELTFAEMHRRLERVALAYQKTFEWLFLPPVEPAQWTDYVHWLRHSNDSLYWITGKAGAGKSTLMRFIFENTQTQALLEEWSGGSPLTVASFFFWNAGTELQKSFEGLLRSLISQILEAAPRLISVAFPRRVLDGMLLGRWIFQQEAWTWSWDELLKALDNLLDEASKTAKVAIFIDGMDEFQGKPPDVIDFVRRLAKTNVKVCASSRPWNQFRDAFGHGPHLRVERLTRRDIETYVTSNLTQSKAFKDYEGSNPGYAEELINSVCEKSDGVFLWVCLVVNSLLEGFSDGERPTDLQKRLESLPTDLEDLFDRILGSLDS
ncbi:hypothetical protein E8E11_008845 [Didymella keratinophila]|nr:hypothetical protein E8E11_008845 [Didymella keratinophila]